MHACSFTIKSDFCINAEGNNWTIPENQIPSVPFVSAGLSSWLLDSTAEQISVWRKEIYLLPLHILSQCPPLSRGLRLLALIKCLICGYPKIYWAAKTPLRHSISVSECRALIGPCTCGGGRGEESWRHTAEHVCFCDHESRLQQGKIYQQLRSASGVQTERETKKQ